MKICQTSIPKIACINFDFFLYNYEITKNTFYKIQIKSFNKLEYADL